MNKNKIYPFAAIVGREELKTALILNVINPGCAGVLIKGEKGAAKSAAVRALAASFSVTSVAVGSLKAGTLINAAKRRIDE